MPYRAIGQQPDEGDLLTGFRTCRKCDGRKSVTEFHWTGSKKHRRRAELTPGGLTSTARRSL